MLEAQIPGMGRWVGGWSSSLSLSKRKGSSSVSQEWQMT
jgi:hypothetical protein